MLRREPEERANDVDRRQHAGRPSVRIHDDDLMRVILGECSCSEVDGRIDRDGGCGFGDPFTAAFRVDEVARATVPTGL